MNLPLLYRFQGLHRQRDTIEKRLEELHEARDLKKLREEYIRLRDEYLKLEEKLKKNSYQQELKNNEIKNLDYSKKTAEAIKFSRDTDTLKKLENIEKQLEKLDERKKALADEIIELINEGDNINKELSDIKKRLVFIKKKYLSSKECVEKSIAELKAQKSELDPQIDGIMKDMDKDSMEAYNRLLKVHSDPVALVEKRKCSGCKMEVPAMDYNALKGGATNLRCQNCGRLLYYMKA